MTVKHTLLNIGQWTDAPLQIEKSALISTDPTYIFEYLADPIKMCRLFPWMHKITVTAAADPLNRPIDSRLSGIRGYKVGSIRKCEFGNGLILQEQIVDWLPPHRYVYKSFNNDHPFGMTDHVGVIELTPLPTSQGSSQTQLSWRHYFRHPNPAAMRAQLNESMSAAVDSFIYCWGGRELRTTLHRRAA